MAASPCVCGAGIMQRLNLMWLVGDAGCQTSDALLERTVLGGVNERVDAAAGEHQDHGEVIEPTSEVDAVAGKVEKKNNLIGRPANEKSTANHQ